MCCLREATTGPEIPLIDRRAAALSYDYRNGLLVHIVEQVTAVKGIRNIIANNLCKMLQSLIHGNIPFSRYRRGPSIPKEGP